MNKEQVPSSQVIAALKQEVLRRKSRTNDNPSLITNPPSPSPIRVATPDLPPLDIPLQPCFDRRLQASIHAPENTCDSSPPTPEPHVHAPHPTPCNSPEPEVTPTPDSLSISSVPSPPSSPAPPPPVAPPQRSTCDCRPPVRGSLCCSGFSDSNWAEDRQDHHSTSAYTYRWGVGAISWKSHKQASVSLSSTKAEYKAMSDACKEGLWLRHILRELKLIPSTFIPLHVDNAGAEALSKNPEHHSRMKHINASFHFIRDCVKKTKIQVLHVSTKDMMADMLTKPLSRVLLQSHRSVFGVV
ncbi:hypothetical protein PCANC_20278 [Puccinia coronata f. sp. avenae]|uniref:Reverse transcriptase Ty1/copia-type domain-containing protein n=1 Tax=Puccinia coronata f. sp. avenae TaxID=200324 RepID=A0A2N5SL19_9BASI|nr:hypothetical protein PCANC_20278 [Puccinia coronata f. sp. avenae]